LSITGTDPGSGPAEIRKQLESIDAIEKEFTPPQDARAEGILERLNRARIFYRQLLVEMSAG